MSHFIYGCIIVWVVFAKLRCGYTMSIRISCRPTGIDEHFFKMEKTTIVDSRHNSIFGPVKLALNNINFLIRGQPGNTKQKMSKRQFHDCKSSLVV